jgi:hypothetical protein
MRRRTAEGVRILDALCRCISARPNSPGGCIADPIPTVNENDCLTMLEPLKDLAHQVETAFAE